MPSTQTVFLSFCHAMCLTAASAVIEVIDGPEAFLPSISSGTSPMLRWTVEKVCLLSTPVKTPTEGGFIASALGVLYPVLLWPMHMSAEIDTSFSDFGQTLIRTAQRLSHDEPWALTRPAAVCLEMQQRSTCACPRVLGLNFVGQGPQ